MEGQPKEGIARRTSRFLMETRRGKNVLQVAGWTSLGVLMTGIFTFTMPLVVAGAIGTPLLAELESKSKPIRP